MPQPETRPGPTAPTVKSAVPVPAVPPTETRPGPTAPTVKSAVPVPAVPPTVKSAVPVLAVPPTAPTTVKSAVPVPAVPPTAPTVKSAVPVPAVSPTAPTVKSAVPVPAVPPTPGPGNITVTGDGPSATHTGPPPHSGVPAGHVPEKADSAIQVSELDFLVPQDDGLHKLPPYVPRPCPCTMQTAMYLLGGSEVLVYSIVFGIYTSLYNNFVDPENLNHYESMLVRAGEWASEELVSTNKTTAYIAKLCLIHILLCCFHILASIILIIGAFKRNAWLCGVWMVLISCFLVIRIVVVFLMPIRVFSWGTIWILLEVYYLYAVACFIHEIRCYPQGYVYVGRSRSEEFSDSEMRMIPIEPRRMPMSGPGDGKLARFQQINRRIVYYESLA